MSTQTDLTTLIQYVEIWLPNEDESHLRRDVSRSVHDDRPATLPTKVEEVECGVGIVGKAWQQNSTVMLRRHAGDRLPTIGGHHDSRVAVLLAVPIFSTDRIRGVVVLGLASGFGAAEVWNRVDRDELAIGESHYSGLPALEFITRYTRLPKQADIPGQIWASGEPQFLQNPSHNSSFVRSLEHAPAQIEAAIGIPVGNAGGFPASVLLLLSSVELPLARSIELWPCDLTPASTDETALAIRENEGRGDANDMHNNHTAREAVLQQVADCRAPTLVDANNGGRDSDTQFSLAIPIFARSEPTFVLNLTF